MLIAYRFMAKSTEARSLRTANTVKKMYSSRHATATIETSLDIVMAWVSSRVEETEFEATERSLRLPSEWANIPSPTKHLLFKR